MLHKLSFACPIVVSQEGPWLLNYFVEEHFERSGYDCLPLHNQGSLAVQALLKFLSQVFLFRLMEQKPPGTNYLKNQKQYR